MAAIASFVVAIGTMIGRFTRMCANVFLEIATLTSFVGTSVTFKGHLAGVGSNMRSERTAGLNRIPATRFYVCEKKKSKEVGCAQIKIQK